MNRTIMLKVVLLGIHLLSLSDLWLGPLTQLRNTFHLDSTKKRCLHEGIEKRAWDRVQAMNTARFHLRLFIMSIQTSELKA